VTSAKATVQPRPAGGPGTGRPRGQRLASAAVPGGAAVPVGALSVAPVVT